MTSGSKPLISRRSAPIVIGSGKGRLVALLFVADQRAECGPHLAQAVDGDVLFPVERGQAAVPGGGDGDVVAALGHPGGDQPRLAVGAADERRVVVGGDQDPHSH